MTAALSAQELGRRLSALPEPPMRQRALREVLAGLEDEQAVRLIGELCRAGRHSAPIEVALLSLAAVLDREELGYERCAALYQCAKRAGDDLVARLLLCSGRPPGPGRHGATPQEEPSKPLGWRKTFARSARRDVIERLLRDPDPSVLEILLQNPRLVERDAVTIAARRPTSAAAQRAVFASRYGARAEVRRALVMNPYTPSDLGARLLPGLPAADLVEVTQRMDLAEALRDAAATLLLERRGRGGPRGLDEG